MGDMDFKVAGTEEGITALQMDIKIQGIPMEVMKAAVAQARDGRMHILGEMLKMLDKPREEMSPYAPRMYRLQIDPSEDRHGHRPGRQDVIRGIIEETGCTIDIEDDGSVFIGGPDGEAAQRAISIIEAMTKDVEVGTDLQRPRRAPDELRRLRRDRSRQGRPRADLGDLRPSACLPSRRRSRSAKKSK